LPSERPTSGAVIVNGQNVGALKRAAVPYLRRNIGLVFQDQKLLYDRSVFDNVMLPLALSGQPPQEAARRARAALDKVGLLPREKSNPIELSGGEQQRLAIARAVVNRPALLIADEPTANLDAESAAKVLDIFIAFNQVGVTVLIATHDLWISADLTAVDTCAITVERTFADFDDYWATILGGSSVRAAFTSMSPEQIGVLNTRMRARVAPNATGRIGECLI
jgi:ABC-type ATPase involved in cell division